MLTAVLAGIGSAGGFAVSTSLQHVAAGRTAPPSGLGPRGLRRLVVATVRQPIWLGGLLADAAAVVLHAFALQQGSLSLVQPLLILGIVFALPLNHRLLGTRIRHAEIGWSAVLGVGLTAFLVLIAPAAAPGTSPADVGPAVLTAVLTVVVVVVSVRVARGLRATVAAALLGAGAGVLFAGTAALLKVVAGQVAASPVSVLVHPALYLLLAVGAAGLVVYQLAFQAGPLSASLPAFTVVDPLVSLVIGVAVFDDRIAADLPHLLPAALSLVVVVAAATRLAGSAPAQAAAPPTGGHVERRELRYVTGPDA